MVSSGHALPLAGAELHPYHQRIHLNHNHSLKLLHPGSNQSLSDPRMLVYLFDNLLVNEILNQYLFGFIYNFHVSLIQLKKRE